MLYPANTLVKAFKSLLAVSAASALFLMGMWFIGEKIIDESGSQVLVNEVLASGGGGWDPFIELYNSGSAKQDLGGYTITYGGQRRSLFGSLTPGQYRAVYGEGAGSYEVCLNAGDGRVLDCVKPVVSIYSTGRLPDGGSWVNAMKPTPGAPNEAPTSAVTSTLLGEPPTCPEHVLASLPVSDIGYEGDLCDIYVGEASRLDPHVLERLSQVEDPQVLEDTAYEVLARARARQRFERASRYSFSENEFKDSVEGLIGSRLYGLGLEGEVDAMDATFKKVVFDIVLNGTVHERSQLRLQIRIYLENRGPTPFEADHVAPEKIRFMLSSGASMDEILVELGF